MLALKCNQNALRAISIYNLWWLGVLGGREGGGVVQGQGGERCTRNIGHRMNIVMRQHIYDYWQRIRNKLVANDRRMQIPRLE